MRFPYTFVMYFAFAAMAVTGWAQADPNIGLYYYPWYGNYPGGHSWDATLRAHLDPAQAPEIGYYSARDPSVVSSHIDQTHQAGADFWSMSWWGPTSTEDTTIRDYYLPHPRFSEIDFAIHYESLGRFRDFADPDYSRFIDDFRHLATHYFAQPNYLKIDGKPVVFLYLTRAFFSDQASRDLVGTLRTTIQQEFGQDLFLVGDDFFGDGTVNFDRAQLWDAITNFDVFGSVLQSHNSTSDALYRLEDQYDNARAAAHSLGVGFIPTASPGFNTRGHHPAAPRYLEDEPIRQQGSLFTRMLNDVVVPRTDQSGVDMLMINSFNEWHEDTHIEAMNVAPETNRDDTPTGSNFTEGFHYDGFGDAYLDRLRDATSGVASSPVPTIYREVFPYTPYSIGSPNRPVSTAGWTGVWVQNGEVMMIGPNSTDQLAIASETTLDQGPAAASHPRPGSDGQVFFDVNGAANVLVFTEEVQFNSADLRAISWIMQNSATTEQYRAAVRIHGAWYVTDERFSYAGSGQWEQVLFDATASWGRLLIDPAADQIQHEGNGGLALPIGLVDTVGLYTDTHNGRWKFDNFTVRSIPEPQTAVIFALGLIAISPYRRGPLRGPNGCPHES